VALMVDFVLPGWRLSWDDAPHDASTDQWKRQSGEVNVYMNLYDLYVFGLGFNWSLGRATPFGPQKGAATPSTQCNLLYLLHLEPEACCESEAKSYGKR
jgi:hypothetical protein